MNTKRRSKDDRIDGWCLDRKLGAGGNAEVWVAYRHGCEVALKILKRNDENAEPYTRMGQEVQALQAIADIPGVLPLLDYSLPDEPDFHCPAWLAMPIAIPLQEALCGASLWDIVSATQSIASTLVLCADRGVFHRDIKPANLYLMDGKPAVGDFGLAHIPTRAVLTKPGRKFGPLFFLPDEMLNDAASANPGPADVFMLAKTLWVLATGQRLPPQGEIRVENEHTRVSMYWNEPKAFLLDSFIENCTRAHVAARPSMTEVADELSAWQTCDSHAEGEAPDLRIIGAQLNPLIAKHRKKLEQWQDRKLICERIQREIGSLLEPLAVEIAEQTELRARVSLHNHVNSVVRHPAKYKRKAFGPSANVVAEVAAEPAPCGFFISGVGLKVAADIPTISLIAAHAIRSSEQGDVLIWSRECEVMPNTAREQETISALVDELRSTIQVAMKHFTNHLTTN